MRKIALLTAIAGILAVPLIASAAPAVANRAQAGSPPAIVLADAVCGQGWHWQAEGYVGHGKWRPAHCVPD